MDDTFHVGYRYTDGKIYYTKRLVRIRNPSEELVFVDFAPEIAFIRSRCGNPLSKTLQMPTLPRPIEDLVLRQMAVNDGVIPEAPPENLIATEYPKAFIFPEAAPPVAALVPTVIAVAGPPTTGLISQPWGSGGGFFGGYIAGPRAVIVPPADIVASTPEPRMIGPIVAILFIATMWKLARTISKKKTR